MQTRWSQKQLTLPNTKTSKKPLRFDFFPLGLHGKSRSHWLSLTLENAVSHPAGLLSPDVQGDESSHLQFSLCEGPGPWQDSLAKRSCFQNRPWNVNTVYTVLRLHFVRSYDPFFLALHTYTTAPSSAAATPRQIAGIRKSFQPNGGLTLFSVKKSQRDWQIGNMLFVLLVLTNRC